MLRRQLLKSALALIAAPFAGLKAKEVFAEPALPSVSRLGKTPEELCEFFYGEGARERSLSTVRKITEMRLDYICRTGRHPAMVILDEEAERDLQCYADLEHWQETVYRIECERLTGHKMKTRDRISLRDEETVFRGMRVKLGGDRLIVH